MPLSSSESGLNVIEVHKPGVQRAKNKKEKATTYRWLIDSLIEKAGHAHGWEKVGESKPERVVIYFTRHKAEAHVTQ
jgi:hypothetical protein